MTGRPDSLTAPRLSVIVPCLNNAGTLGDQLEALANQEYTGWWELILADNGSTDDSLAVARQYASVLPHFRILDASARRGAGHARNVGARAARGDYLLFCDADDRVGSRWLDAMAKGLEQCDFVASRVDIERLNEPWIRRTRQPPSPGERLPYPPYLPHAGGSGLGVRKEKFDAVGSFDESLPRLQDTDLCIRLQLAGTPLHFADEAVIHCRYQTRSRDIFRQALTYADGNARLFARYAPEGGSRRAWVKWPLHHWLAIVRALAHSWDPGTRRHLVWEIGWQVGRLRGSLRYRVPAV